VFVYNLLQNGRIPAGQLISEWEHFCRNVMVSVRVSRMSKTNIIFIDPGARSIVRTIFDSSWDRVCCLISKQDVANTNGHFNRMVRRHTQHVIPQIITTDYLKKENIDFIEPDMWPQTSPILILLTLLFGGPFSKEYPIPRTKILHNGRTEASDNQ